MVAVDLMIHPPESNKKTGGTVVVWKMLQQHRLFTKEHTLSSSFFSFNLFLSSVMLFSRTIFFLSLSSNVLVFFSEEWKLIFFWCESVVFFFHKRQGLGQLLVGAAVGGVLWSPVFFASFFTDAGENLFVDERYWVVVVCTGCRRHDCPISCLVNICLKVGDLFYVERDENILTGGHRRNKFWQPFGVDKGRIGVLGGNQRTIEATGPRRKRQCLGMRWCYPTDFFLPSCMLCRYVRGRSQRQSCLSYGPFYFAEYQRIGLRTFLQPPKNCEAFFWVSFQLP